jgi:hypothetical protein
VTSSRLRARPRDCGTNDPICGWGRSRARGRLSPRGPA